MNNFLAPGQIAEAFDQIAFDKANNRTSNLLILGIFAGMFIALGGFASQMMTFSIENTGLAKFASGAIFPVGLMLVIMAGGELFTGNSLMIIGYMDKKISLQKLIRNWVIVYLSNFLGAFIFCLFISESGLLNTGGGLLGAVVIKTAIAKTSLPFNQALIRGILCNIMVVLAVWLATGAKDFTGKIFGIWFPIMLFVLSGFEHCVANMYYIPLAILSKANNMYLDVGDISIESLGNLSLSGLLNNLIPVTIGNIIGGAFVIGLSYWYIYRYTQQHIEEIKSSSI